MNFVRIGNCLYNLKNINYIRFHKGFMSGRETIRIRFVGDRETLDYDVKELEPDAQEFKDFKKFMNLPQFSISNLLNDESNIKYSNNQYSNNKHPNVDQNLNVSKYNLSNKTHPIKYNFD